MTTTTCIECESEFIAAIKLTTPAATVFYPAEYLPEAIDAARSLLALYYRADVRLAWVDLDLNNLPAGFDSARLEAAAIIHDTAVIVAEREAAA